MRHRLAIEAEGGVEYFVPAMLGVGLGEHHQFGVAGLARQRAELHAQVIDFIRRQRQAQRAVRRFERIQRNPLQWAGRMIGEQGGGGTGVAEHGLGHRVVQYRKRLLPGF